MDQWEELGNNIYSHRYEALNQNIGLIVGSEEAIVIDTRGHHAHADELRRDIAKLTSVPVTTVVNTHMHWDHTFGNARFPEARIVGHVRCRSTLLDFGPEMRDTVAAQLPPEWGDHVAAVEIVPPEVTFEESMTLTLDDRQIRLAYLGRAHTDNDISLLIDDVVMAGDLIEEGAPPAFGSSFPSEWPVTLADLLEEPAAVWLPGHGRVVGRAFVESQAADLGTVAAVLADMKSSGRTEVPPGPFQREVMELAWMRFEAD